MSKLTVPVGVPVPGATATRVAVSVTGCPKIDGFVPDDIVAWLSALFTVCATAEDVLLLKFVSPT
jgi:hypothetical protein